MGKFVSKEFFNNTPGPKVTQGLMDLANNQAAILEMPFSTTPVDISIQDGALLPTSAIIHVDTEGEAPSDELTTITYQLSESETWHNGGSLWLKAKDPARSVTVINSQSVNGIQTADGKNITLSDKYYTVLQLRDGKWFQVKEYIEYFKGASSSEAGSGGLLPPASAGDQNKVLHGDGTWKNIPYFNTRIVITESNEAWESPFTGFARVTVIGGGGAGGAGGYDAKGGSGGKQGGSSSFSNITAKGGSGGGGGASFAKNDSGGGGGGQAGEVVTDYVFLSSEPIKIVIGAGGVRTTDFSSTTNGLDGEGPAPGKGGINRGGGGGAPGSSNGGGSLPSGVVGSGGSGGLNFTGYGSGGGGGAAGRGDNNYLYGAVGGSAASDAESGGNTTSEGASTHGGAGGQGAVIIEYYDPDKEAA